MHNAHGFVAGLAPKSKLNVEVINEHLPSCPHRMPLDAIPTDVSHWFPGDLPSETRWFYMIHPTDHRGRAMFLLKYQMMVFQDLDDSDDFIFAG